MRRGTLPSLGVCLAAAGAIALSMRWGATAAGASGYSAHAGRSGDPLAASTTGLSSIEHRYVYALPDEGEFDVPLTLDVALPGEFSIQEPAMLAGGASVHVSYSKSRNVVSVDLKGRGLPYRPTFTRTADDSSAFDHPLATVHEARWRLWLIGTSFGRQHEDLYYSETIPHEFLGTRYDFPPFGSVPPPIARSFERVQGNARQMIASPLFEGEPGGDVAYHFSLPYDRLVDDWGTPGAINIVAPMDLCEPDALSNYWTQTKLPDDKIMTWDTFLQSIWSGEGIGFMMTAEPVPSPGAPRYRSSAFVGWANVYPATLPRGFGLDYCTFGTVIPLRGHSDELAPWPPTSRRHPCRVSGPSTEGS